MNRSKKKNILRLFTPKTARDTKRLCRNYFLRKPLLTELLLLKDTQVNFLPYLDTEEYFSHCTDDKSFYQLLLIQWQTFLTKINLNPSARSEKTKKEKKEKSLLLLKSKC